jgi:hypothetical protein
MAGDDQTRFVLEHTYVKIVFFLNKNSIFSFIFRYAWTWSLILSDVSDDDAGEYTCRVSSSSDDQTLTIIKRFNLTVLSKHIYISHTSVTRFDQERRFRLLFD